MQKLSNTANTVVNTDGTIGLADDRKSDFDARIIAGYAIVWGQKKLIWRNNAKRMLFKINRRQGGPKSAAKYKVTHFWQHDPRDPSITVLIYWKRMTTVYISAQNHWDAVTNADREIIQLRSGDT